MSGNLGFEAKRTRRARRAAAGLGAILALTGADNLQTRGALEEAVTALNACIVEGETPCSRKLAAERAQRCPDVRPDEPDAS